MARNTLLSAAAELRQPNLGAADRLRLADDLEADAAPLQTALTTLSDFINTEAENRASAGSDMTDYAAEAEHARDALDVVRGFVETNEEGL